MDLFIEMMPAQYIDFGDKAASGYLYLVPGMNELGPTMRVEEGPLGRHVFSAIPHIAKTLADFGNDLIIDEVLLNEDTFNAYVEQLKGHTVYFIGIYCDLKVMQEREMARDDRVVGLSNDQINRVHLDQYHYDLKVDTTHKSALLAAKEILAVIKCNAAF
jgi:chloramphenicol 3-O phosphotransferase